MITQVAAFIFFALFLTLAANGNYFRAASCLLIAVVLQGWSLFE